MIWLGGEKAPAHWWTRNVDFRHPETTGLSLWLKRVLGCPNEGPGSEIPGYLGQGMFLERLRALRGWAGGSGHLQSCGWVETPLVLMGDYLW